MLVILWRAVKSLLWCDSSICMSAVLRGVMYLSRNLVHSSSDTFPTQTDSRHEISTRLNYWNDKGVMQNVVGVVKRVYIRQTCAHTSIPVRTGNGYVHFLHVYSPPVNISGRISRQQTIIHYSFGVECGLCVPKPVYNLKLAYYMYNL